MPWFHMAGLGCRGALIIQVCSDSRFQRLIAKIKIQNLQFSYSTPDPWDLYLWTPEPWLKKPRLRGSPGQIGGKTGVLYHPTKVGQERFPMAVQAVPEISAFASRTNGMLEIAAK